MKSKLLAILSAFLSWPFALSIMAHAGQTVMSTSDSAPLYPTSGWNKNTEVVIGTASSQTSVTTTVTLTTTSNDGGAVFVSYTPGDGITEVSNTGWGTSREVVTYSFLSSCIGNVNTISINASHDGTELDVCSNGTSTGYTICIPKITITIGNVGVNNSNHYRRDHIRNVVGLDDLNQVKFLQKMYNQTLQLNESTGTSFSPADSGDGMTNSGRWVNDPPDISPVTPTDSMVDPHETIVKTAHGASGTTSCYYCYVTWRRFDGDDVVTRASGGALVAESLWGYQWDNYNARMGAPNPALPSDIAAAAFVNWDTMPPSNALPGEFYGWYAPQ